MGNPIQGKKIFILDDDTDFILLVTKILENAGAEVISATDLDMAQEMFHEATPHLALVDMNLSRNTTGKQFINYVSTLPRHQQVPIVVVSAHNDYKTLSEFEKDEIDTFIVKPIRSDVFLRKIKNVMKKKNDIVLEFSFGGAYGLIINIDAEICAISELGCHIEAPVSMGSEAAISIESPFLESLGIDACRFVASGSNHRVQEKLYRNDVDFIGLNEETLTKLRKVKQFK